jgi:predicted metal-binding membrane protein
MATPGVEDEPSALAARPVHAAPPRPPARAPWRRAALILALALLSALAWCYLLAHALKLYPPGLAWLPATAPLPQSPLPWQPAQLLRVLGMWAAVMAAVMLPPAAPLVLLFSSVCRLHHLVRFPGAATALFVLASLAAWCAFAVPATLLQWALHDAGFLDRSGALVNSTATGLALAAAGAWQWTPLKHASLDHCRSPLSFVLTGWRPGAWGALRMGASHGLHCLGCCWALVLLLIASGLNLPAVAALAALVAAEKLLPHGAVLACLGGLGLVAWGTVVLFP